MNSQKRPLFGLFLVLIGLVLLLSNLGVLSGLPGYIFSWINIFLLLAIANLFSRNYRGVLLFAALWGFFILRQYTDIQLRDYWPLILVVIGLSMLMRKRLRSQVTSTTDDSFDEINIFGGSTKKYTSTSLKGGKITNIFGGSEIDLRDCQPEKVVVIEVLTLFGGCELIVPKEWNISVDTTAIFGGFDDKREASSHKDPAVVYIKGITIFGGGSLKSTK